MHKLRLGWYACFCALLLAPSGRGVAQETFSLRGIGGKPGLSWVNSSVMRMTYKSKSQGQTNEGTSMSKIRGTIRVNEVDEGGDITAAQATYSGEISTTGEPTQKFPSEHLVNQQVKCRRDGGAWTATLEGSENDAVIQKELEDFPMPGLQREYLPIVSVPVGYKWETDANEYARIMEIQNPKYAKGMKGLTGRASFVFENVARYNGVACAYIKAKYSFKGVVPSEDDPSVLVSLSMRGTSSEIRRIDTGSVEKTDSTMDMDSRVQGMSLSMSMESSTTTNYSGF